MIDIDTFKAVLFDGDDTLYTIKHSIGYHYHSYFTNYGISSTAQDIDQRIPDIWKTFQIDYLDQSSDYKTDPEREERLWKQFVSLVVAEFCDPQLITNHDQLLEDIYLHFSRPESREISPDVEKLLSLLKKRGLTTGVLTNNDQRTPVLIAQTPLHEHIDHIFCACDLGYKKPALQCFQAVQRELDVAPHEILYIGDHFEQDYLAAQQAGWHVILFGEHPEAERFITHFGQLLSLISAINDDF